MIYVVVTVFICCGFVDYCCCVVAGIADRNSERMYNEYIKKNTENN